MITYIFNRNEFIWMEEFYEIIQKKMQLPNWFGKNADALWDILTGFIETPCKIVFVGFNKKENDYNENAINLILDCFKDAMKKYPNNYTITFIN